MRIAHRFIWFAVLSLVLCFGALAHDAWLVPVKFHYAVGEEIIVDLNSGMDFPKSLGAVTPERIAKFQAKTGDAVIDISDYKVVGDSLRATFPTADKNVSGTVAVVAAIKPKLISLSAKDFNEYLAHDGLTQVLKFREEQNILDKDAVELYAKYPKTLVQIGDKHSDSVTKPIGSIIEIIPLKNPYMLTKGNKLTVKVLFRNKPLIAAEVAWSYPGQGESFAGTVMSDKNGMAEIPLEKAGPFVIRTINMEWVKKKDYEWESHWTSLTFEVAK